jgi:hypothetical protein
MESDKIQFIPASDESKTLRQIAAIFEMHIKMFSLTNHTPISALKEVEKLRAQGFTYSQLRNIATVHISDAQFRDYMRQLDEEGSRDD